MLLPHYPHLARLFQREKAGFLPAARIIVRSRLGKTECIQSIMEHRNRTWKRLLKQHKPLLLPSACDALTAKLIEQAGFPAYQIGGFALDGMRFGFPDMDVTRLGEKSGAVRDIVHASNLPVLVDCDDGYGDEKNVVHTVHTYDDLGVAAIFMEDQKSPKKCGHMGGKEVVEPQVMVNKLRAAICPPKRGQSFYSRANRCAGRKWSERCLQPRRTVPESGGRRNLHRRTGKCSTIARDWQRIQRRAAGRDDS